MAKKKLMLEDMLVPKDEIPYEVPENWCWVRWGNLGEFIAGTGFKPKYQGFDNFEIPFYKVGSLKNVDENGFIVVDENTITEEMRLELKAKLIPKNSILFAKVGEAIKLNRRALTIKNCCIDNNTMSFQTKENINYRYIYYWSKTIELYDYSNATTVPSIRKSDLEQIPIPLPPLAEQERIVNRIESLFEKVDRAAELVDEARDSFEKRRAAILERAFSGELTKKWREENGVSDDWEVVSIKNILNPMTTKKPNIEDKTFRYIDIDAIDNKKQVVREPKLLEVAKAPSRASREVREGDTLFSLVRPYLKNIAYIDKEFNDCIASTGFYVCRPNERILPKFLYNILCRDKTISFYTSMMKGDNSPSIRKGEFESLEISLPSIDEQKEMIKVIDKLLEKERDIEELCNIEDYIDVIKKSILAKAFRGELGSNNLNE